VSALIERGASFDGYRVERLLGRGGMGVVYEATQVSLGRRVALKVLRPELAEDPGFVSRFRREGRLQASLEHPHVLDVYEVGESEHGLYLAMRLVEGRTVADLLRDGELGAESALDLLGQAADALDAAHAAGLVHRDVKPENVLVADDGTAYLADFGLTRGGEAITDAATRPALGTVAYVAPEVIRGESPGPAADRYAFAASLFHCLTGDVVFPRGSEAAVLYAHASEPPPRPTERRPELPASLDAVFADALAKDPEQRPARARDLIDRVRRALGPDAVSALGPPASSPPVEPAAVTLPPRAAAAEPTAARAPRRLGLLAAVALVSAGLGAGVVALIGGDDDAAEVPVPPVPAGAQGLGSALPAPDRTLGCRGAAPAPDAAPCAIAQSELPDATLLVPSDGTIRSWAVRGASGELALDVLRPRGDDTTRVARSQWESAGNVGPHEFETDLAVEGGDLLAIELGPGATIGVRDAEGATTERWFAPTGGFYGSPDRKAGTGFDYEVLLRGDFVEGGTVDVPRTLTGAAAAAAPDGRVRERQQVTIDDPPAAVTVEVVEVDDRIALDLVHERRRRARIIVPGLIPGGRPVDIRDFTYEGESSSEVDLWWVNPNSGRSVFHFFEVSSHQLRYLG
jgi:hypothetical protein